MTDQAARERIERWKQSLIAGPGEPRDRLLDLVPADGLGDEGLGFAVDPVRVAFSLAADRTLLLGAAAESRLDGGTLHAALEGETFSRRVRELRRASLAARGSAEQVLWCALGMFVWVDAAGASRVAPLALWPVEIDVLGDGRPRMRACAERGPRVNDKLVDMLQRQFEITIDVDEPFDLEALIDCATSAVWLREGWRVERTTRIVALSFTAFDLMRDLDTQTAALASSLPIAWLTGERSAPALGPVAASDMVTPLEADASQLAAIAAAGAGQSFVLDAPPGTGATQTIANLAVHCASHGQTVLVVSDRASGLDAIEERLATVSLGDACLPLHAGRTRANATLARVFERTFRPVAGAFTGEARLAQLRGTLDGTAAAMHRVGPLGASVHEVLGRLVELRTAPCAALAERDAAALDRTTLARRKTAVRALADAAAAIEPVASHPWRASAVETWHSDGTERATRALNEVASVVATLDAAIAEVGALVPNIVVRTPEQLRALGALAELAAASPRPGAELLSKSGARFDDIGERIALIRARGGGSLEVPRDAGTFLAIATRHRALAAEVRELFTDAVDELAASDAWSQLKRWTGSMAPLRYVALRNARAQVRAAAQAGQMASDEAMIAGLEAVIAERACREALLAAAEPARRWLGELGGDALALDLRRVDEAMVWASELRKAFDQVTVSGGDSGRQAAWRALVAQVASSPEAAGGRAIELAPFARVAAATARLQPALADLAAATGVLLAQLGAGGSDHLAALREQVGDLSAAVGALADWARFHLARREAIVAGVGPAVAAVERGDLGAADLAEAWERATLLAWLELELAETPALAQFDGASHHALVSAFTDLDRGAVALDRSRAVSRLAERMPRARDANEPELPLLRADLDSSAPRALRSVLAQLPTLLPRIAPIVLATPSSLAEHLDPALSAFDVVVVDEAACLPIAHALGALVRAKAVVIAGDARQPGPADGESVLALALAARLPVLPLAVHHRSRHEDLFAFANRTYYGDRLELLPVPYATAELGVRWRQVAGTVDTAGANRVEAEAIVAELRARLADEAQAARTFAVVTLSRAQQDLVTELIEAEPQLASRIAGDLLVGTPDRLQGEARDVVFLSIGASADALGALAQPGGERWLMVATTRARDELVIVSSFAPEDIAADAAPCARDLATLLAFARAAGGASKPAADVPPASPITAAIARALTDRGWTVKHQFGCGGYKLDLVVVDPDDADRYVLAIEHDGPAYAGARAARSRDRLRAQLLAARGWRVHRIWSLDWWLDPEREVVRAHGAIVAAIAAGRHRRPAMTTTARNVRKRTAPGSVAPRPANPAVTRATDAAARILDELGPAPGSDAPTAPVTYPVPTAGSGPVRKPSSGPVRKLGSGPIAVQPELFDAPSGSVAVAVASGSGPTEAVAASSGSPTDTLAAGSGPNTPVRLPRGAIGIGPYLAAAVPAGRRAPDDMFAPRYAKELEKCVERVLAAEAPIHIDVLARRVGAYFGVGRVSAPVLAQIRKVTEAYGRVGDEPGIVWRKDQDPGGIPAVRVAGQGATGRRDISEVPLAEVAAAARIVVERANGVSATDLVRDCARLLGFARITADVTARVELGVRHAAARELIAIDGGRARLMLD